jgi:hypothetical protein
MMPQQVKDIVATQAHSLGYQPHEIAILQRYYLRFHCTWLSLSYIARLTGSHDHTCVVYACRCISNRKWQVALCAINPLILPALAVTPAIRQRSTNNQQI